MKLKQNGFSPRPKPKLSNILELAKWRGCSKEAFLHAAQSRPGDLAKPEEDYAPSVPSGSFSSSVLSPRSDAKGEGESGLTAAHYFMSHGQGVDREFIHDLLEIDEAALSVRV